MALICISGMLGGLLCTLTACSEGDTPTTEETSTPTEATSERADITTTDAPSTTKQPPSTEEPEPPQEYKLNTDLLDDMGDTLVHDIPINEVFIGLELPTTVSDIEKNYQIKHNVSRWVENADVFSSEFLYEDKHILISTRNTRDEIKINSDSLVQNEYLLIFDKKSTVSIETRMFVDILSDLIDEAERIEDLIQIAQSYSWVDSVQVSKNGVQIFEGELKNGMFVRIEYDDGESKLEYFVTQ